MSSRWITVTAKSWFDWAGQLVNTGAVNQVNCRAWWTVKRGKDRKPTFQGEEAHQQKKWILHDIAQWSNFSFNHSRLFMLMGSWCSCGHQDRVGSSSIAGRSSARADSSDQLWLQLRALGDVSEISTTLLCLDLIWIWFGLLRFTYICPLTETVYMPQYSIGLPADTTCSVDHNNLAERNKLRAQRGQIGFLHLILLKCCAFLIL